VEPPDTQVKRLWTPLLRVAWAADTNKIGRLLDSVLEGALAQVRGRPCE